MMLLSGLIGVLMSPQLPLFSQVVTYCPDSKLYRSPGGTTPVTVEVPAGGIGMVSASDVRNRLNRDPRRMSGWVEVFVVNGRGGDPKGPYWMRENDFRCGTFMGV